MTNKRKIIGWKAKVPMKPSAETRQRAGWLLEKKRAEAEHSNIPTDWLDAESVVEKIRNSLFEKPQ